jgi:hypothetical protein
MTDLAEERRLAEKATVHLGAARDYPGDLIKIYITPPAEARSAIPLAYARKAARRLIANIWGWAG